MRSYILLRDNQEMGSYSLKDLKTFGLTSTDLIWIEGESTCWLYPGDIPELAALGIETGIKRNPGKPSIKPADAVIASNIFYTTEILQTQDTSSDLPEKLSIYSSKRSRRRKSVSIGASLFGFTVLLIGTAFFAFVVKKMVDGFDDVGFFATAEAKTIREEVLSPSTSSHAARTSSTPLLTQTISNADLVTNEPAPPKPVISKAVLVTAQAKEKKPAIDNVNLTGSSGEAFNIADPIEEPLEQTNEEKEVIAPPKPAPSLQLSANDYSVGMFGGISNLELSVTNPSSQAIQKAIVEVEFLKPNGTVIKSQTIFVENLSPGSSKKLPVPDSNRGVKIRYKVVNIQVDEKVAATDI